MKTRSLLSNQSGLSLIEVILAVVILSVGIVGVLKPMLSAVGALTYLDIRNTGQRVIHQKLWELEDEVRYSKGHINLSREEPLLAHDRTFSYMVYARPLGDKKNLDQIRMELSWKQGGGVKNIVREFYVLFPYREKEGQL